MVGGEIIPSLGFIILNHLSLTTVETNVDVRRVDIDVSELVNMVEHMF